MLHQLEINVTTTTTFLFMRITVRKFFINVSFKFTPGEKLLPTLVNSVGSKASIEKFDLF